ncbi:Collagen alpha-6(VI) chain [Lamellibrachia satsuma]|nr:Collagen alpha-6(VI) chain [Lamellibrachia satsuma]
MRITDKARRMRFAGCRSLSVTAVSTLGALCVSVANGYTCGPCPEGYTGDLCQRACDGTLDIAFVLDASGSIRRNRFELVLQFVIDIVARLDVHPNRVRVGLVTFSDTAHLQFYLNSYQNRQDVIQAIRYTPYHGGRTHTASALKLLSSTVFTSAHGHRTDVPKFTVVITDGNSNINERETVSEAIQTHVEGVHVIVVPIGKAFVNMAEIEAIASEPKPANIIRIDNVRGLESIVNNLTSSVCDDVNECLSNPCHNGARCIDLLKRYVCRCTDDYTGVTCERYCTKSLDLVFVMDLSGSVENEYEMSVQFAQRVVYGLNMRYDRTRVAVVTFSTTVGDQFYLNSYTSKDAIINAMNFHHKGGRTNTQEALNVMRTTHFTPSHGQRTGVRNVAVLISDGNSNINADNTVPEADRARSQGIDVYSVGLGRNPNLPELNDISNDPDSEYVVRLPSLTDVDSAANELLERLCK